MDKEERKKLIADLRVYHEPVFKGLGVPAAYFCCKHAHYHDGGNDKVIGLFDSEVSKGDAVFIEFTSMDYKPSDASRRLYKWEHNPNWKDAYKRNEKTSQWLIPTSELHVVHEHIECKLPIEGRVFADDIPFTEMTVFDFFAIIHRTPVSNKKIINDLINKFNAGK